MTSKMKRQSIAGFITLCFAVFLSCAATAIAAQAQTFTTLVNFDGTNGTTPDTPLVQGRDGNLYGTTLAGGTNNGGGCAAGCGTIFKVTPAGAFTVLYNFCAQANCSDGSDPRGALVQDVNGDFYGTTFTGGANDFGDVFKITPAGLLSVLQSFDYADGEDPSGALAIG